MTRDGGLAPVPLDGGARAFAQALAERWRATGLGVSLDLPPDEAGPGEHYYVLTARTPSRVLACTCQAWRRRGRPWPGRTLWTVAVKLRRPEQDSENAAGVAGAAGHAAVWREVIGWIEGSGRLHPGHEEALAAALAAPRAGRRVPPDPLLPPEPTRSRAPVAAAGTLALLLAAGGAYWAAHRTHPDAVDTAAAARPDPQVAAVTSPSVAPAPEPPAPAPPAAAPPLASAPVLAPTPPSTTPDTRGRFAVHLASVRDPARVPDEWRVLVHTYPALAGLELLPPQPVEIPGQGTFYRVSAGPFPSRTDAQAACERVKGAGGECTVLAP